MGLKAFRISLLLLVVHVIARAATFQYQFTTNVGSFSFTESSLITSAQTLSFSPFTLNGLTFTQTRCQRTRHLRGICFS